MKLNEIRNGMVIETKIGARYVKINDRFIGVNGSLLVGNFTPELINIVNSNSNIERVFKCSATTTGGMFENRHLTQIWVKHKRYTLIEAFRTGKSFKHEKCTRYRSDIYDAIDDLDSELINEYGERERSNSALLSAMYDDKCWVVRD